METGRFDLGFSVSATNRQPRANEQEGVHYYFLTTEAFQAEIEKGAFVEWEEVFPGRYYGTLKREIDGKVSQGRDILLDIDVKGALNVKRLYGEQSLTIFVEPPSIEELRKRLINRGTDSLDVIDTRIGRAAYELSFADKFDKVVVNDRLEDAVEEVCALLSEFLTR